MQAFRAWLVRKKRWLRAAVGRAIRCMAQAAACAMLVLVRDADLLDLDVLQDILRSALYTAVVFGVASVLWSIYNYPKSEEEQE